MAFLRFQLINTGLIDVHAMENESALSQQDLTRMKNNEETMFTFVVASTEPLTFSACLQAGGRIDPFPLFKETGQEDNVVVDKLIADRTQCLKALCDQTEEPWPCEDLKPEQVVPHLVFLKGKQERKTMCMRHVNNFSLVPTKGKKPLIVSED